MPALDGCPPSLRAVADACQEALAYRFADPALLAQALGILTPPLTPGQAAIRQRLEFLGDAAWNFAVADTAFRLWPHAGAGDLTRLRATWSSRSGMARLARQLGLPLPEASGALPSGGTPGQGLFPAQADTEAVSLPAPVSGHNDEGISPRPVAPLTADASAVTPDAPTPPGSGAGVVAELPPATIRSMSSSPIPEGPSERVVVELPLATARSGASSSVPEGPSDRVVAELFEAILGAVVMDGGLDPVRDLACRIIGQGGVPATPPPLDPKSALQILAQSRFGTLPIYRLLERRGPPHQPIFRLEVTVRGDGGNVSAQAEGSSRQAAERDAARRALDLLSG